MSSTLTVIASKDWYASIGKASASDWITVAAYLVAGVIAIRAARAAHKPRERLFWSITSALMVFLGINELFDMQTILTAVGKAWARSDGWYEQRRTAQLVFIIALGVITVAAGAAMLRIARGAPGSVKWALLGLVFIGAFVMLRAASFHHVDRLLGMGPDAFNFGSIQEMAGILIIGLAAWAYAARSPARRRPRRR